MKLEAIHVIQWFLCEQQTIRLGEITGFFGSNGCGKSSLLDAVQVAVFGANSNLVSLNAQADEINKSTRTIRGYCLGQYGESPDQRVRDTAQTYISLIWRTLNGHPITIGVALEASSDSDRHEVMGRYVADGIEVSLSDHLIDQDGVQRPRDWRTFREDLLRRVKQVTGRTDEVFYDSAEKYIKATLTAISLGKDMGSMELFKRAFRFSMRLRSDKPVDEIIRQEVLEARPTNIRAFQEVTESFRHLHQLVERIEKQLAAGEKIEQEFANADKQYLREGAWTILAEDVEDQKASAEADGARSTEQRADEALQTAIRAEEDAIRKHKKLNEEQNRLLMQRDAHRAHNQSALILRSIKDDEDTIKDRNSRIQQRLREMSAALRHAAGEPSLSDFTEILEKSAADVIRAANLEANARHSCIEQAIQAAGQSLTAARSILDSYIEQKNSIADNLATARGDRERASEGKAPLPPNVTKLLNLLRNNGIEATPICDLVRISEPRWQSSIEALLRENNTTALIVPREEEVRAFSLYREHGKTLYGVKLVLPGRLRPEPISPGTLGELLKGDADAVAFLRTLVGSTRQAESDDEALSGGRALTPDGMYVKGYVVERLRLPSSVDLRLGDRQPATNVALLNAQILKLDEKRKKLDDDIEKIHGVQEVLASVTKANNVQKEIDDAFEFIAGKNLDIQTQQTSLDELSDDEYRDLCKQLKDIEPSIRNAQKYLTSAASDKGEKKNALQTAQIEAAKAVATAKAARNRADETRATTPYDSEYADDHWDELIKKFPKRYVEQKDVCLTQAKNRHEETNASVRRGLLLLSDFVHDFTEQPGPEVMTEWRKAWQWLTELLTRLRDTTLAEYKADMLDAERTSQETFRTDVAVKLSENIRWLKQQCNRLNDVLRNCPEFTNGERYQFRQTVRPQYAKLLNFITNVADTGPNDDFFAPEKLPDQFMALLEEYTNPQGKNPKTPLDDYREFYTFDIEIRREGEDGSSRLVGHLSKRLGGDASGGERRAPLYVIAGAALASAYGLDVNHRNGMRVVMFDEAFDKIDQPNVIAIMRYLDNLGLQVLLACPDTRQYDLMAFLHRSYYITRDVSSNMLFFDDRDVSQQDRELMRSDLLEFNPHLIDEELANMKQERIGGQP
jgi:energy-coupling factor transporter ATP-binding protein EcfA2